MTESFDIAELLTLAKDNSPESRMRLFGLMGDLFMNKGGYLSTEERTNLSGIITTLLPQADKEARLKLAYDLSGSTAVPRELARRIGEDEIDVASPMLFKSTKLTDQDLIELAARSPEHAGVIATRRGLPMKVADTLMQGGQTDVVQALLDNASSQISIAALHTALDKAKSSEDLQDSISRRVELPEEIAAELMEWAGGRVRERLMDRFNILMVEIVPPSEADEELPPLDLNQYNKANGVVAEPEPDPADMPPTGFARYGAATNATPQPIGLSSLKPKPAPAPAPAQGDAEEEARLEETRLAEAEALRTKAKKDLVAKTLAALAHDNQPEPAATPVEEASAEEPTAAPVAAKSIAAPAVEERPIDDVPPPSLKRDLAAERLTFDAVDMELELIDVGDAGDMPPIAEPMAPSEHELATASLAMNLELELEQAPALEIEPPEQTPTEITPTAIETDEAVADEATVPESAPIEASTPEAYEAEASPTAEAPEFEAPQAETVAAEVMAAESLAEVAAAEIALPEVQSVEVTPDETSPAETASTADFPVNAAAETLDVAESFALAESMAAEAVAEIAPEPADAAVEDEPVVAEPPSTTPEDELPAPAPATEEAAVTETAVATESSADEPAKEEVAAIEEMIAEEPVAEAPIAEESFADEAAREEGAEALEDAAGVTEPEAIEEPIAAAAPPVEEEPEPYVEPVEAKTEATPVNVEPTTPLSDPRKEALLANFIKSSLAPDQHTQAAEPKIEAAPAIAEPTTPISDPRKETLLANFIKSALASAAKVIPGVSAEPPASETPVSEAPASETPAPEQPIPEMPIPEVREAEQPAASSQREEVPAPEEELLGVAIEQPAAAPEPEAPAAEIIPESEPEPEPELEPEPLPVEPAAAARKPLPKGAEHKLTTTLLIAMLNNGGLARAEAMFAQMTGLRIGLVRRLAAESGGEGLAMAARAIHMAREDFSTIYLLWRKLKSRDGFVSTNDHGKALDFFDSAPQDRVMSVMNRWRKDPEKLFATG